uniref:Uncharacterized protein n=1 Tax=Anopheles minimus TaxID=112268 RepID=A0A182W7P9_9DIPT
RVFRRLSCQQGFGELRSTNCSYLFFFLCLSNMNERLWEFGQQLPVDNKFQAVLKLALLRKSLDHEAIDAREHYKMCRKCYIPWTAGYFTVEVIPKCKRSRKQVEQLQSRNNLTKQQQSLVKHLETRAGRVAKYTCQICSYKTRIPLDARVKLPERRTVPAQVSKAEELKASYDKWCQETQRKRKHHGKSNAGLKIPVKPFNNTYNAARAQDNTPPGQTNRSKDFKVKDFKLIQQLLASSVSPNADTNANQKPKGNQPVGRLRLSRN